MVCGGRDDLESRCVGTARGETEDMAGEPWLWWVQRAEPMLILGVCENRDGWLVAWGLCGSMLIRFSTVWLLPFTLL